MSTNVLLQLYTSILGSIWKEKKISILDFFCKEKNPKKRKKNKVQNYCLQANIEKQEKDIISFKNFLFFLTDACKHNERVSSTLFLFNEGKLEIKRSGRFSRSEVITYTTLT